MRSGPPTDDEADLDLPVWAGVIPLELKPAAPLADEGVAAAAPAYAAEYGRRRLT